MNLTERGWAALGLGVGLVVLWVLLGEIELLAAASVLLAGLVFALAVTRLGRPRIEASRRLTPTLVHEGDHATVSVQLRNPRLLPLAELTLTDEVGSLGTAEFEVGRLPARGSATARYQILCRPRGVYRVGPLRIGVSDPIRLAVSSTEHPAIDRLIVYPEVEDLSGFPRTRGRDPAMHASRPEHAQRGGEDFYTLREYVIGDDLRYVHWPSSAKRDELMIRQLETPWQSRALVLFDIRRSSYESEACFEKAVRGTASVIRHLARTGFDADLWAGGTAPTSVAHHSAVMELLALVQPVGRLDLRAVAARLRQGGAGGALVLVTGVPDRDVLEVHRLLSRDYRTTLLLSAAEATSSSEITFQRAGALTMTVPPSGSWAEAWRKTVEREWLGISAG